MYLYTRSLCVLGPGLTSTPYKYWAVTTLDPLQVYCDIDDEVGWTVIMRRSDMDVSFDRTWDEYKHGFGNISGKYHLTILLY